MKEEILKRKMFSEPVSKKTMNSGIMQGFEDEMEDEMEDEAEEMPPMARSPQNPEILMNNLRGDIRSVDARYLELAQMVGEQAASETPPEVLAMLQPQLAAPQAPPTDMGAGIAGLPQAPQGMPQGAPMMPPGMEGAAPFPEGGASQAPPTPDGLPPLRAQRGAFVTQGNRLDQLQGNMDRMLALASGNIPPEQMTEEDARLLQQYNMSMGFSGGIRDAARQGMGRIGSALEPYIARGTAAIDRFMPNLQGFRVAPMRGSLRDTDAGRMVVQGRENIRAGAEGMPVAGTGTKFERANTLEFGNIPFSQGVRESMRTNPVATSMGLGIGGGTAVGMLANMPEGGGFGSMGRDIGMPFPVISAIRGGKDISNLPPDQLAATLDRINQIPTEGMPSAPAGGEPPASATINRIMAERPDMGIGPFGANVPVPVIPPKAETAPPKAEQDLSTFIKDKLKEEAPAQTRGERIKAEFKDLAPTFKELLGDTKSDIRTNALLLLADAGFKFASTYKPTMGMALGEALSGVPRGFASLVAQARDRDIKINTAALQQAVDNVNLQDKLARDLQLKQLDVYGRTLVEQMRGNARVREAVLKGDYDLAMKQLENQGFIFKDGGMGMTIMEKKNGTFEGSFIRPDKEGNPPPVVKQAIDSNYTLRPTDNPFVTNRGPAPTTVETDKGERVKLGNSLRSLDNSLRMLNDVRGQYSQLYSPGTWFQDKINNVIVPISGGVVRPDVDQAASATRIASALNMVQKQIASANDSGRVAVQEQEWAREMLGQLNNPTAFFANKDIAAKQFAAMEAQLRNARQQVMTQLGFITDDLVMNTPSTGSKTDPFVISADPEERTRMLRYLASTIGMSQDPRATVYVQYPNGRIDPVNPPKLRELVQK
jgi:hypothetical protein